MIETLIAAGIFTAIGSGTAYFAATRKTTPKEEAHTNSFICPYCHNLVTGFKELDLIHHVACIGKSQADLEAEAKKPKKKTETDEYFIRWGTRNRSAGGGNFDAFNYSRDSGTWWTHTWEVYRNGSKIDSGTAKEQSYGQRKADEAIEFDKHQRRTRA